MIFANIIAKIIMEIFCRSETSEENQILCDYRTENCKIVSEKVVPMNHDDK